MKTLIILIVISSLGFTQNLEIGSKSETKLISTIGSLASSNIYLSYLSIDLISEQVIQKKITPSKSSKLILSLSQINEELENSLKQLYDVSDSDKDAKLISRLIMITNKMKLNSKNLEKYIKSQSSDNLKVFKESHKSVYNSLQLFFSSQD